MHEDLSQDKIRLPSYSINTILGLRAKLMKRMVLFYGQIMAGETLQEVAEAAAELLKAETPVVTESLTDITGSALTSGRWAGIAWRLAGNLARLRRGQPVHPWTSQTEEEWVPLQVEDVVRKLRQRDKAAGVMVTFRALAGTPCPMEITRFWTVSFVRYLKTVFGFSRFGDLPEISHHQGRPYVRNLPFSDSSELSRLRIWGLFTPDTCSNGQPGFQKVFNSKTFKDGWNRDLLVLRTRLIDPCPRGYEHACHSCHIGFSDCPAGCHRHTYEFQRRRLCAKDRWCDVSGEEKNICVDCAAQGG